METGYSVQVRWHLRRYGRHLCATCQRRVARLRRRNVLREARLASPFSRRNQQRSHGFQAGSTILGALPGAVYSRLFIKTVTILFSVV